MILVLQDHKIVVSGAKPEHFNQCNLKEVNMRDYSYDHKTLLNGSPVDVEINVSFDTDWDGDTYTSFQLVAVYFDGVDVSPILDKQTLIALEMEAQSAIEDNRSDIPSHFPTL